jgi:septum formation protein
MKTYLASASPRRKELLAQIGIEFEIKVSDADEKSDITDPAKLVEELSRRKAFAVVDELKKEGREDFRVIGADTVVALEGKILGKPKDKDAAVGMLKSLSGKSHDVFTGVTVVYDDGKMKTFHERTVVSFYEMTDEEIKEYVESGDPLDKAGSYGIQGFCARYISGIRGDYNNVVGLPIGRLYQEIKKI